MHRCIHAVSHQVEDHAAKYRHVSALCGDEDRGERRRTLSITSRALSENELEMMEHSIAEMEKDCGLDRNAALADMRYTFIEKVCQ